MDCELTKTQTWAEMHATLVCSGTGRQWAHPFPPLTLRAPQSGCEPIGGPAFELLVLNGP